MAFACALMFSDFYGHKDLLLCTTIVIILITIYVQGGLTVPLLHYLGIRTGVKEHMVNRKQEGDFERRYIYPLVLTGGGGGGGSSASGGSSGGGGVEPGVISGDPEDTSRPYRKHGISRHRHAHLAQRRHRRHSNYTPNNSQQHGRNRESDISMDQGPFSWMLGDAATPLNTGPGLRTKDQDIFSPYFHHTVHFASCDSINKGSKSTYTHNTNANSGYTGTDSVVDNNGLPPLRVHCQHQPLLSGEAQPPSSGGGSYATEPSPKE